MMSSSSDHDVNMGNHPSALAPGSLYARKTKKMLLPNTNKNALRGELTMESILRILSTESCQIIVVVTILCMVIITVVQDFLGPVVTIQSNGSTTSMSRPSFENIADIYSTVEKTDVPLLWEVDTRINSVVGDILLGCFNATRKDSLSQGLKVDFSVLSFAQNTQAENGLLHEAQILVSPHLKDLSKLFNPDVNGRLISFFRHPAEIIIKRHHYLTTRSVIPNIPFKHFLARSPYAIDNIMVRSITGILDPNQELTENDLKSAEDFLRRKCIIGLINQLEESLIRLEYLFLDTGTWVRKIDEEFHGTCVKSVIEKFRANELDIFEHYPQAGSPGWQHVERLNELDVRLFLYAHDLFNDQVNLKYKINKVKPMKK